MKKDNAKKEETPCICKGYVYESRSKSPSGDIIAVDERIEKDTLISLVRTLNGEIRNRKEIRTQVNFCPMCGRRLNDEWVEIGCNLSGGKMKIDTSVLSDIVKREEDREKFFIIHNGDYCVRCGYLKEGRRK